MSGTIPSNYDAVTDYGVVFGDGEIRQAIANARLMQFLGVGGGGGGGSTTVTNLANPHPVTVSNFPATQPISGTVAVSSVGMPTALSVSRLLILATGTARQLPSLALNSGVTIKALPTNAGTIDVGISGVTQGGGFPLLAGESVFIAVSNLNFVFINGTINEGVAYSAS